VPIVPAAFPLKTVPSSSRRIASGRAVYFMVLV
jgi:hypothetical protein